MAFNPFQTPQKPLPGAFLQTPAASRFQAGSDPQRQLFRPQSSAVQQAPASQPSSTSITQTVNPQPPVQAPTLQPVQRAARTINDILKRDASFPDLDSYVKQGISSDYEVPSASTDAAWAPYQKSKMYDIPDAIFEQYNRAQVSTMMGLFAELNHAWVTIDNALYLWDYTAPSPELKGFEDQPNSVTAVKLVKPKPGVFKPSVTHVLVLATTMEILLLGVEASRGSTGVIDIILYRTQMSLSVKGLDVRVIEGSATGRIFFGGGDNEVYELKYQQEEKWFLNRCGKVNHTSPGYASFVPSTIWGKNVSERVVDIAIDDTRNLVYVLSSESSIRTFHMDSPNTLKQVIEKKRQECLRDISHMTSQSPLLTNNMRIVSISPISATEASKLHLMATTSTGCRLFLSATRGYGYLPVKGDAPQSMQVQHIKFPPREQSDPQQRSSSQLTPYPAGEQPIDTQSRALEHSRRGLRYPPGLFLCFVTKDTYPGKDVLFLSAPDTGRIAAQARETGGQGAKYFEQALWLSLDSHAEAIGLITKPFAAEPTPLGFGNELAVQYDEPSPEIAILTNTGIHTVRRRRLVDIFAAALRQGGGDEGLDGQMKRFIRQYGRGETTAAALAVACGQGADLSSDPRAAKVTDPAILDSARKAFVEFGGKPSLNENAVMEASLQAFDHVRPSARHEGLALYISRLVRSLWNARIIRESILSTGLTPSSSLVSIGGVTSGQTLSTTGILIDSTIPISKLRSVQDDISKLDQFLEKNKTFIEGLAGPDGLHRAASKQEEIALQGEHQALHSLQMLAKNIIEGISFVMMLFDERVNELWVPLEDTTKQRLRDLTYVALFTSNEGKDLGKVLVKAIVNRNIANGSNVDTVADALRRKCSSFCSAGDVMVFKAQEQLKKASEIGANSEAGRSMLNESVRLFKEVAEDLSFENLQSAVTQFTELQFYAGAIELCLSRAEQIDRGHRALNWVNDGKPEFDRRLELFEERRKCYNLIHGILQSVDQASSKEPQMLDGRLTIIARKRNEAYDVVNRSEDELFHDDLYDWYLTQGWTDRLLAVQSPYIITYLQRLSTTKVEYADLLWRHYANSQDFYEAATVQLDLAKSDFPFSLKSRVEYLSMAKANASTNPNGGSRQARQVLLHEVSELLEVATIQDELLQRLKGDPRIDQERKVQIVNVLNGRIVDLTELYNSYADQASYFDICLLIYRAADYRNTADISATWLNLLQSTHQTALDSNGSVQPFEAVITTFMALAPRLNLSETIFPADAVIPMLERYAFEYQRNVATPWTIDLLATIDVPYETILPVLETMFYNDEAPFHGHNRSFIALHMLYVIQKWYGYCITNNQRVFGSEENAVAICQLLSTLTQNGLDAERIDDAHTLRRKIERSHR